MIQLLFGLFIIAVPFFTNAQQSNPVAPSKNENEALKKEMQAMHDQLQKQMNALQESISKLNQQIEKSNAARDMEDYLDKKFRRPFEDFELPPTPSMPPIPPMPGVEEEYRKAMDCFREQDFHRSLPDVPEMREEWSRAMDELHGLDLRFEVPQLPETTMPYNELKLPELHRELDHLRFDMPNIQHPSWKRSEKRHEEFLKMLPFYDLFKS
ncbi:MAG TPA: hypothetical protein PLD84_14225 [Chitinophagales bacterium]|nr:hypothetical protein [Chitinophagales bacterium]